MRNSLEGVNSKWDKQQGRLWFVDFSEFLNSGIQVVPLGCKKSDLQLSWKITKRILGVRSKPRVLMMDQNGNHGYLIYRNPRIYGEEYLTKALAVMKSTSEEGEYL